MVLKTKRIKITTNHFQSEIANLPFINLSGCLWCLYSENVFVFLNNDMFSDGMNLKTEKVSVLNVW